MLNVLNPCCRCWRCFRIEGFWFCLLMCGQKGGLTRHFNLSRCSSVPGPLKNGISPPSSRAWAPTMWSRREERPRQPGRSSLWPPGPVNTLSSPLAGPVACRSSNYAIMLDVINVTFSSILLSWCYHSPWPASSWYINIDLRIDLLKFFVILFLMYNLSESYVPNS